jgi:hypothetical protein
MTLLKVCLFSILLISCSGKERIPSGVLPVKQMQQVMWDIVRADEMVDYYQVKDSLFKPAAKRYQFYDTIFTLHKINKDDFKRSMDFYQSRPDLLKIILDSLQKKSERYSGTM